MRSHFNRHSDVIENKRSHRHVEEFVKGSIFSNAGILRPHTHDHREWVDERIFKDNQAATHTVWTALGILLVTSILQLVIVFASGSVALLGDTVHNLGDGLNSIPLLAAFYLARKAVTKRYTYGYNRAEDIAGIFIVISILVSAAIIFWEAAQRLINPQPLENLGWVAAAAVIGFLGNELVATLQIKVGNRIGSAAMVADGLHARTDGLTSLAVLLAAGGVWLGFPLIDPIIGILIGIIILFISYDASKRIWFRLMDAVDPDISEHVQAAVERNPYVKSVERIRIRWVGHHLQGDIKATVKKHSDIENIRGEIFEAVTLAVPKMADMTIELKTE